MKKYFYNHLVEISFITAELGDLDLSKDERIHLVQLAEENIHNAILDAILSELSEEDKKIFLHHLAKDDHDKVWEHLKQKIENIEDKIKSAAESIKKELHRDIKEIKNIR